MFLKVQYQPFFKILTLTAAVMQSMSIYAEEESIYELPVIEVQAIHTDDNVLTTPASIYQIEASSQQNNSNVNISEVLQGVPGLQINNRENYAQDLQMSIRGFGARSTFGVRGIRLYVDGIPATMPDGQGQSSNIDLNSLSNIEILTGPFSSLYGNSSGGTVLAQSKEGEGRDSIQVGYNAGSHQKQQANIVLQGGSKSSREPSYVISSSYFDTNGYREHSGADKTMTNAKLTWKLDDGSKINWVLNRVNINADDAMGLKPEDWKKQPKQTVANAIDYNTRKEIEQTQTGLTWTKPINDQNELYVMGYFGNRAVTQYQSIPAPTVKPYIQTQNNVKQAGGVIDFTRNYYGLDLRWKGMDLLPNMVFVAGIALDQMDEDRKGYKNYVGTTLGVKGEKKRDEDNTLWNVDPYLQASWQFLPTWRIDTGVRYSNVHYKSVDQYLSNGDDSGSKNYQKVLPSVALSWEILPQLNVYSSYGKGFETPTFTEMAYRPDGEAGFNFALKPASSDNYELGLKFQNDFGLFTAAVFHTKTQNDIVSYKTVEGRATYQNSDETLRKGAELSWQNKFWKELTVLTTYSYIDAQFHSDFQASSGLVKKGNAIPGIAKNQAFARLAWQPEQGLQAGLDVRYMDKMYVNDLNADYAPSYTLVGVNIGYLWKNADWTVNTYARLDNVFDRDYVGSVIVNDGNSRFFEPADGRNLSAGLSISKAF